jgi:hypothetical protein
MESVHEDEMIDQETSFFLSRRIIEAAEKYDIEIPQELNGKKTWQNTEDGERSFLSAHARSTLRKTVDAEKTRRFEAKTLWVTKIILPLVGVLVGLIGAATGFIAVWRHGK